MLDKVGWKYLPWEIVLLCCCGEKPDFELLEKFETTYDTASVFDMLDVNQIHSSWSDAKQMNVKEQRGD